MNRANPCRTSVLSLIPAVLLIPSLVWTNQVIGAPITFNTALPVAKGEFVAREQLVVNQSGDDPSGANRDRTEAAAVTALGYGVSGKWALFGVLPYRDIDLDLTSAGQRVTRSNNGFGDLSLFARYTAYQHDRPGRTFRVAPFAGVKAPTGNDDASDGLGTLQASVQVGSGSWDYFGGVVLTYQTLKYQFDSQLSYRVNNEANGFEAGDIARLDGSYQHRLWRSGAQGVPDYLYGVIEVNVIHQDRNRLNGNEDPNSGGTQLFLTPGIQYVTKRWILEGAVQVPIVQDLNGTALENDYIIRAGVRFNF
ncbi:MAG: transporter [Candidatus Thiodiazotropha endolucinida]